MEREETLTVGKITHHRIELRWGTSVGTSVGGEPRVGTWTRFTVEQEESRKHTFTAIYVGYGTEFTVEQLEPSSLYRFRLKNSCPATEDSYSQVVSVSTAREPVNGRNLHQAVVMNDEEKLIRVLQAKRVDVNVPDRLGYSPLMVASMKGYSSLVSMLVLHGADVNMKTTSGKDSLMLACFCGQLETVRLLRGCGALWTARDRAGCTALHWAVDGAHLSVIKHLIEDGCEVDVKDSVSGWTPLMRVSAITGNAEVALLLLRAGAYVNVRDKDGKTPLMIAVLNNHEDLVILLLENGADRYIKNEYGSGAREMAKAFDRKSIVRLLEGRRSH